MNHEGGSTVPVAAVFDIGSNSILLLVVTVDPSGRLVVRDRALETSRLGAGLRDGGGLAPDAVERTRTAVRSLVARARAGGAELLWGFATGAARSARDGRAFVERLSDEVGFPVAVLSGEEEARLAFRAVADSGLEVGSRRLAVDVGGGSVELTLGAGREILGARSLPLGALRLSEGVDEHAGGWEQVRAQIADALASEAILEEACGACLVVTGGTASALATLDLDLDHFDPSRLHGHRVRRSALTALCARLVRLDSGARAALPGLDPGRGRILPAGALVVAEIAARVAAEDFTVSEHGVRHAVLLEQLVASGVAVDRGRPWR